MATTQKGIYYPNDYSQAADIPQDMKDMAESIDTAIGNSETTTNQELANKVDKVPGKDLSTNDYNNTEKAQVETNKNNIEDLQGRVDDLEKNALKGTASGTSISITDSADSRVKSIGLSGNSIQNGTPTISNSVEIESCGDNENLYNENITPTHYFYNAQGVRDENPARTFINQTINNLQKKSLAISYSRKVGSDTYIRINEYNTSGTFIKRTMISTTPYSLTLDTNTSYIIICVDSDTDYYFEKLKIEYSSTATVWSPYGRTITEKIESKNKFNIQSWKNVALNNNNSILVTDDSITINNTTEADTYTVSGMGTTGTSVAKYKGYLIRVKPNTTYTLSCNINGTTDSQVAIHSSYYSLINSDYIVIRYNNLRAFSVPTQNYTFSITTSSDTKYIALRLGTERSVSTVIYSNIQLEEGSFTSFTTHKEQIYTIPCQQPMRAVDNTRDIFVKVNGVWYERHNILRKTFDGTESWTRGTINVSNQQYTFYVSRPSNAIPAVKVLSNRFSYSSSYSGFDNRVYMGNSTLLFSRPKKSNDEYITTVDEWKTYIASNELYVDYQLNTPTDLQCTEEQITALEAFIKARTYKGITYMYDEDEVEAVVDMIYFKDLEMAINNITNAVVSLGGNV